MQNEKFPGGNDMPDKFLEHPNVMLSTRFKTKSIEGINAVKSSILARHSQLVSADFRPLSQKRTAGSKNKKELLLRRCR